ncbi:hypothetical protein A5634_22135 [Mycobacterium asiaticum]|uniref:Diacylglycerol O-acyltransferase n=1 Tax=Mycobacterium asiaticum TaxID=1790 RepID=A0A1A3P0H7_MYCAS|nr:hypothetical protein [Mycobacterium asiaticum]OBK27758.1 hypothetical protein A5634_22135 [Mycobacterium asiaticum]
MRDVIDLFDQAIFVGERATGMTDVVQYIWLYNRAIDSDALQQFHCNLKLGRLSRLIERLPVPFGRHRWVSSDCHTEIEVVSDERDRSEFDHWLEEQAHSPIDPERGPGWHLALLRFTDGGTGISLVTSHCIVDGTGLNEALSAAASELGDARIWSPRGTRRRLPVALEDTWQTVRELPEIGRAAFATIRRVRSTGDRAPSAANALTRPIVGPDVCVTMPTATVFIDARAWDAQAQSLGGTSNTLLAGLAVRIAERVGRVAADGSVLLTMPVDERTADDTRGNAVAHLNFTVDPASVTPDLRELRATIKMALRLRENTPDERRALLPIVPLLPQWLVRRIVGVTATSPTSVNFSNLGTIPALVARPDGTQADRFAIMGRYPGMTQKTVHRIGGRLQLVSGRAGGLVFLTVLSYEPGCPNSDDALRQQVWDSLADFSLEFRAGWQ